MQWFFDYPWGPVLTWLVVIAVFAVLGVSFWTVRKEIKTWSGRIYVIGLRVLAAVMVIFMLLQPQTKTTRQTVLQSFTGVVLDTSKSMSVRDTGKAKNRFDIAKDLLLGRDKDGLLEKLKQKGPLRIFQFSKDVEEVPLERVGKLEALGDATAIGTAIADAQAAFGGDDLTSLVVITDGIDNAGRSPRDVVDAMETPVPIFVIGIGEVAEKEAGDEKDRSIDNVQAQNRVLVQKTTEVLVTVSSMGFANGPVPVQIFHDKELVTSQVVTLGPQKPKAEALLNYTPQVPGKYVYTVKIPLDKDELNKENNERMFTVHVIDPVNRVLYVEGAPRWESKFVNRLLNANRNLNPMSYVRTGPDTYLVQGNVSGAKPQPPLGDGELEEFKVLILGDVGRDYFTEDQLARIAKFVESGGSLLLLGTKQNFQTQSFAGTPLARVLPVAPDDSDKYNEMSLGVKTTPEGAAHPIFQAITIDDWSIMPPLETVISTGRLKAGATPLLVSGDERYPIVVVHQYGQGKVVAVLSDSLWRWQVGQAEQPLPMDVYTMFWTGLIDWLLPKDSEAKRARAVEVVTDKDEYESNQVVRLLVTVTDAETGPAKDAAVKCVVQAPDGKSHELHAPWGDISAYSSVLKNGYSTSFTPHRSGKYSVIATAERGGQEIGREEISFMVGDPTLEFRETDINRELLEEIARISKGKYYTPQTAPRLLDDIVSKAKTVPTIEKNEVWNEWWVLVAFVALMTSEWIVRKKRQLA